MSDAALVGETTDLKAMHWITLKPDAERYPDTVLDVRVTWRDGLTAAFVRQAAREVAAHMLRIADELAPDLREVGCD
jgi:hypothetical protein